MIHHPSSIFRLPSSLLHLPLSILRPPSRVSRWGPVLVWMAGIFYFSSRPNPLGFLPSYGGGIGNVIEADVLAHMGEYAGLLLLVHRALANNETGQRTNYPGGATASAQPSSLLLGQACPEQSARDGRSSFAPFVISLAYAIFDELHQELVPGRGFELADIGYDLAGIMVALGLVWIRHCLRPYARGVRIQGEEKLDPPCTTQED